jgi:hypothetical protein
MVPLSTSGKITSQKIQARHTNLRPTRSTNA